MSVPLCNFLGMSPSESTPNSHWSLKNSDNTLSVWLPYADIIVLITQMSLKGLHRRSSSVPVESGNGSWTSNMIYSIFFLNWCLPESAVKYWRQSAVGAARLLHSYWATFMFHCLVVPVLPVSMSMFILLHWSEAGTHMCWPVL